MKYHIKAYKETRSFNANASKNSKREITPKHIKKKMYSFIDGYLWTHSSKEVSTQMAIWVACGIH